MDILKPVWFWLFKNQVLVAVILGQNSFLAFSENYFEMWTSCPDLSLFLQGCKLMNCLAKRSYSRIIIVYCFIGTGIKLLYSFMHKNFDQYFPFSI